MKLGFPLRKKKIQLHHLFRKAAYNLEYLAWLLFSVSKFKKYPTKIKDVVIISTAALGDNFYTLRTASNLIKNNPNLNFYLLVTESFKEPLKFIEKVLKIKIISEKDLQNHTFDLSLFFARAYFKKYKKQLGFSVGTDYTGLKDSLMSIRLLFLNKKTLPTFKDIHYIEGQIKICKLARLKIDDFNSGKFDLGLPDFKINSKVNILLSKNKTKNFVVIHPTGNNFSGFLKKDKTPTQYWPLDRFSKIADYIIKKYKNDVIITGTKEENFIADEVIQHTKNKKQIFNFSGKLNIEELISLINCSKLLLSLDTSVVHIATFTKTPVIDLFGPSWPEIVGAYGDDKKQINLIHNERCSKCKIKRKECPEKDNICMKSITIEEVKAAVDELLT